MRIKTISISNLLTKEMVLFLLLFFSAYFAPIIGIQLITGTIVNAMLFLATIFLGRKKAFLIAIFPSIISLSTGLLPVAMMPMIPFIITGNIILVFLFDYFKENFLKAVVLASIAKFFSLSFASYFIATLLIKQEIVAKTISMMSLPQLLTALMGGAFAYLICIILGRK